METELVHDLLDRFGFFIATSEEFPKTAAAQVAETMNKIRRERRDSNFGRKTINIVLTGGKTMPEFIDYLTKIIDKDLWKEIHVYQLCEYRQAGPEDDSSIAYFINRHLPQSLPEENRHFINGLAPDPEYIAKLERAGGADVVVLGIGGNGRIGLNEPSDEFDNKSGDLREVKLGHTGSRDIIDKNITGAGYTMRLSDIMKCRNILLLAEGENKADIVKRALFGPATPQIPASILQSTKHLKVVFDINAMEGISPNFFAHYKKAVRAISRLEERSRDLFEDSPTPQHELNRDGIILRANSSEAKMLGYSSPDDLLGIHVWDLIHPDDVTAAKERVAAKFAKRLDVLPEVEARYITRDGRIIWVLIKDRQTGTGNEIPTLQSTLTDITRYKSAAAELEEFRTRAKSKVERENLEGGAGRVAALLVNILLAQNAAEKNDRIILALDGKLGHTDEIRILINKYVLDALASAGSGNEDLKKVFENLILIDGEAGALSKRIGSILESSRAKGRQEIKKENVVIITADSNLELFRSFENTALITAIDDSELRAEPDDGKLNYYPMLELIFFSVARMVISAEGGLSEHKDNLWEWYKSIPNIDNLDRRYFEEMAYEPGGASLKRTILLKLVPRARRFDKNELKDMYEHIREFITKA